MDDIEIIIQEIEDIEDEIIEDIEGGLQDIEDSWYQDVFDWIDDAIDNLEWTFGFVWDQINDVGEFVWDFITETADYIAGVAEMVWEEIEFWTDIVMTGVEWFLDLIHFEWLLQAHAIGLALSPTYRRQVQKFYNEISKVSGALGLGPHYINLLLNNSRTVVMNTSAMFGKSYDIAEVDWVESLQDWSKDFASKTNTYKDDPEKLLTDLNARIEKGPHDTKSGVFTGLTVSLIALQKTATGLIDGVETVKEDLKKLVLDLPPKISKEIWDDIVPLLTKYDNFLENEYRPFEQNITNALDVLTDGAERQGASLSNIAAQILNPGDMMAKIDNLPEIEKLRQENIIADVSNRTGLREIKNINENIATEQSEISLIFDAIKAPRKPVEYHIPEINRPFRPAAKKPIARRTWFIGEF